MTDMALVADVDLTKVPYGVRVGDAVHFWAAGSPPLSEVYEKPPCLRALILNLVSIESTWAADLAVVDRLGALRILRGVRRVESYVSTTQVDRVTGKVSYGVWDSWHSLNSHPEYA